MQKVKNLEVRMKIANTINSLNHEDKKYLMIMLADELDYTINDIGVFGDETSIHIQKRLFDLGFTDEMNTLLKQHGYASAVYGSESLIIYQKDNTGTQYYYDILLGSEGRCDGIEPSTFDEDDMALFVELVGDEIDLLASEINDIKETIIDSDGETI